MIVWGTRSGKFAAEYAINESEPQIELEQIKMYKEKIMRPLKKKNGTNIIQIRKKLKKIAWEKIGVIRDGPSLKESISEIQKIIDFEFRNISTTAKNRRYNKEWIEALEMENMASVLLITAKAALMREESRAAHYRRDKPKTDYDKWNKNIVIKKVKNKPELKMVPVNITKLHVPKGVVHYGVVR
jgi:succinate dehydrogenase/fumarate reductase flavoprotein subunit